MWGDLLPVRLSLLPLGGQGQPYDDGVVALARDLVRTTTLSNKEIAARVGVSHMTIGRWARSGNWCRPHQRARTARPWRLLHEAEWSLGDMERVGRADLPKLGEVLGLLLEARASNAALKGTRTPRQTGRPFAC